MAWAGLDQRVFPRVSTQCDLSIHTGLGGVLKTKTENLGAGGVCVILKQELPKLSQVHVRIGLEPTGSPVECEARVVWIVRSKELISGKISFDTGLEFIQLPVKDQERITHFIQSRKRV